MQQKYKTIPEYGNNYRIFFPYLTLIYNKLILFPASYSQTPGRLSQKLHII